MLLLERVLIARAQLERIMLRRTDAIVARYPEPILNV